MTPDGKYKALIISGVTKGHDPRIVPMLSYLLETTGKFVVKVTEEFRGTSRKTLEGYDVLIYDYDGKENSKSPYIGLGAEVEQLIFDFVADGGGAVPFHTGILMGEPVYKEEFARFVGIDLDLMNGTAKKSPKYSFTVDINNDDPITDGLPSSFSVLWEDLFFGGTLMPGVKVLATVDNDIKDYDMSKAQAHIAAEFVDVKLEDLPEMNEAVPMVWKHNYGKGRVFSMFLGNHPTTFTMPAFAELLARGTEWAASGKVTIPPLDMDFDRHSILFPFYNELYPQDMKLKMW